MDLLQAHDWPGNVRDLQCTLTRAAHRVTNGSVCAADVLAAMAIGSESSQHRASLRGLKFQHDRRLVEACAGDTRRAAVFLVSRGVTCTAFCGARAIDEAIIASGSAVPACENPHCLSRDVLAVTLLPPTRS